MNERIRQLAEQAGIKLPDTSEYNGHIYRNSIDKFARLIVRECIKINTVDTTALDLPEYNLGMLEGYRRARENISIHFEVEQTKSEKFDQAMRTAFANGVDLSGRETP